VYQVKGKFVGHFRDIKLSWLLGALINEEALINMML